MSEIYSMSEIYPKENESDEDYSDMPALIRCSELDAYNAKNQCFSNIFCIFHIFFIFVLMNLLISLLLLNSLDI